jgi:rhamnose utilization protein RhaD (predicted bifunctional aldolase and dehydrogenase)/NAD(P)-dependent dehydrogenase (short-subunit alcohol dehydrogenase family)
MESKWSDAEASAFVSKHSGRCGEDLALRAYSGRLLGAETALVLHGGGNTSVKGTVINALGEAVSAVLVKESGRDLTGIDPADHVPLDLGYLKRLSALSDLTDEKMLDELLVHRLDPRAGSPSIEAMLHALIPLKYVDHTHADAILALTNRIGGAEAVAEALGDDVVFLGYVRPGFGLAREAARACEASPGRLGLVLDKHGLVTWGESARESYERTISLVTKAEEWLSARRAARRADPGDPGRRATPGASGARDAGANDRDGADRAAGRAHDGAASAVGGVEVKATPYELARGRYVEVAPVLRGALALPSGDEDRPYLRFVLRPLISKEVLGIVESANGKKICLTPPLTSDHLIRTKALPLWIDDPGYGSAEKAAARIPEAIADYARSYDDYFRRNSAGLSSGVKRFDSMPRVVLMPGLGAVCVGADAMEAGIVRDMTEHTLRTKAEVSESGAYEGLDERHLFDMEYFSLQHMKLSKDDAPPLARTVALVTGAAGAIGSGVCEGLLEAGCHVAAADLPGPRLEAYGEELRGKHGERAAAVAMDVTDRRSVASALDTVVETWGGLDLLVANAGVAHAAELIEIDPEDFRRVERVNVEGTLHVLSETAKHFKLQGTGGDVVVISTKNVFCPGAGFGAYSATKAAAHQLARIATLELAPIGVRVNMVSPDAVFGEGERRSGLWAEVGPSRMRARGLDEKGLEEYYRGRNLLKARVTATHVAKAVIFFATRQTPTTGATIPVDGGLPDSTPR